MPWAWEAYASFLSGGKNVSIESKQTAAKRTCVYIIEGRCPDDEDERQRNAAAAGRIKVKFVVSPEGSAVDTQVMKNKMVGGECERFILNVVDAMSFPAAPNGGTTTVRYPCIFNGRQ